MSEARIDLGDPGVVDRVLRSVTYKPGVTFEVRSMLQGFSNVRMLRISLPTLNSDDPTQSTVIYHDIPIPFLPWSEESFLYWLFEAITMMERHEAGEWLRVDRTWRPFMPHHWHGNPYEVRFTPRPT